MHASVGMVTHTAFDYVFIVVLVSLAFASVTPVRAQGEGDIRLVSLKGNKIGSGRVEIYHNGIWGTICDDGFGVKEGTVVCRELNFGGVEKIFHKLRSGGGPIWMDRLECSGEERRLADCPFDGGKNRYGIYYCNRHENAGVRCKPREPAAKPWELPLRVTCPPDLVAGSCKACPAHFTAGNKCAPEVAVQGILEAKYDGTWYPISGSGWGAEEAKTACGQLGYPVSWGTPTLDTLWKDHDEILLGCEGSGCGEEIDLNLTDPNEEYRRQLSTVVLDDTECTGSELNLLDCVLYEIEPHLSGKDGVATVACGYVSTRTEECYDSNSNIEVGAS